MEQPYIAELGPEIDLDPESPLAQMTAVPEWHRWHRELFEDPDRGDMAGCPLTDAELDDDDARHANLGRCSQGLPRRPGNFQIVWQQRPGFRRRFAIVGPVAGRTRKDILRALGGALPDEAADQILHLAQDIERRRHELLREKRDRRELEAHMAAQRSSAAGVNDGA